MSKKLVNNQYVFSIISKIVNIILSFINAVLINRYLGATLKGEYAYILNIVNIISLTLTLGLGQAYSYFKRMNTKNIKKIFISIFILQSICYIIIAYGFTQIIINRNIIIVLILSIITIFNSQISYVALIENINLKNKINIISIISYTVIILFIFLISSENLIIIIGALALKLFIDTFLIFKNFKFINEINLKFLNFKFVSKILFFSFLPMLTSLLITFNYSIDIIILKLYRSYEEIGVYSLGVTLANMLWLVPDSFKDVLFGKTSNEDSVGEIVFGIKFNSYLCLIIIGLFLIFGKLFITIVFGDEFIRAYLITLILFIGTIPMIFFKLINTLYISIGNQKYSFKVLAFSTISNVIMNFITIPTYGILGAAMSSVISYILCGSIFLLDFCKKYKINISNVLVMKKVDIKKILVLFRKDKEMKC